ncbi:putative lipid II flippase FtsW [Nesterenkonia sp.]|uniref:putative lipid II flippase FtsW n=1 Tax=Nesterenkonia sp. TaxID=704201 RepID=UPI00261D5804|nr:putative lipid II flippase FtsW [Nesterenkonia sp.]
MAKRPPRLPSNPSPPKASAVLTPPSADSPAEPTGPISREHLQLVESDGSAGRAWKAERAQRRTERIRKIWDFFEGGNPYTNYWLVLGATLALAAVGLTMVLSSTSVDADGQAFTTATRQAVWAMIGLVGMVTITYVPTRWLGTIGWILMLVSGVLLILVALSPLGHTAGGSTNWIRIGPVQGQPSELAKLALVLWGAAVLARKGSLIKHFTHWMMPFVAPGALAVLVLVLAGGDLGTSIIIIVLVGAMLFAAGVAMRYFLAAAAFAAVAVAALMWITPYRMMRVYAWLGLNCDLPEEPCYQTQQGFYALASGGFWGVGLGQSRQKWAYIPEVENDFIFTIIGEELGLLGTCLVLGLFAVLVVGVFRIAAASSDRFVKFVCMGIVAWLVGQAFINIAMVTGIIPVVGVPLPFISYGGSALTCAMIAVGVVLNFARRQRIEATAGTRGKRGSAKRSTLTAPKKSAQRSRRTPTQ